MDKIRIIYYVKTRYKMEKHIEAVTYDQYIDLILQDNVIIKKKLSRKEG